MRLCIDFLQHLQDYFQVLVPVPVACCRLVRGAHCSACTDNRSGHRVADPATISTISEPRSRKTAKRCSLKKWRLGTDEDALHWTCKPTFLSKDVRRLGPSLATSPCAACQMDQFWVFCESVPRQIFLLGLPVIHGAATGTQVLQFDRKSGAHHTSFNHQPSTNSPSQIQKCMWIKGVTRWRELESTYCVTSVFARNTGTWAFFRTPFSTTFRWRIFLKPTGID